MTKGKVQYIKQSLERPYRTSEIHTKEILGQIEGQEQKSLPIDDTYGTKRWSNNNTRVAGALKDRMELVRNRSDHSVMYDANYTLLLKNDHKEQWENILMFIKMYSAALYFCTSNNHKKNRKIYSEWIFWQNNPSFFIKMNKCNDRHWFFKLNKRHIYFYIYIK